MTDIEAAKELLDSKLCVTTISWECLDYFDDLIVKSSNIKTDTLRSRLRNALNKLEKSGYCEKRFTGTNYYQTSDNFGGCKKCLVWNKIL